MKNLICKLIIIFSVLCVSCVDGEYQSLKVLQLNVWGEGGPVPNGFQGIIDIIDQTDPDVVLLQEIRGQIAINVFIDSLQKKGKTYHGKSITISTALMSKYPLADVQSSTELGEDSYAFTKGTIKIKGQQIVFYSLHWDWLNVGYYLGRGYCGTSWKKLDAPIIDADSVLNYNRLSRRKQEMEALIANMKTEKKKGNLVIIGGDLNEPSHLDWQEDTKDIRDHNGMIINWDCSMLLQKEGYKDTYREIYPNPVSHPGFTCNAGNKDAKTKDLQWALGIDDRERIDFIYYFPNKKLQLKEVAIVGPKEDFYDGKIQFEQTEDTIIEPKGIWPSDHKGNLVEFKLYRNK